MAVPFKWILFGALLLGICANGALYLLGAAGVLDLGVIANAAGPFRGLRQHFVARVAMQDWAFLAHMSGGMLALLVGPFQFWTRLRAKRPALHRAMGFAYFTGVFVGGLGGLISARGAWGGPVVQNGFLLLAILWLASAGQGLGAILKRQVEKHQAWMRLSYALTLAAVSLRLQMPLLLLAGFSELAVYQAVAWTCWVPQAAWWMLRGRRFA